MISPAEIARWSHRFGVSERVIEKDYVLSWLLVAIGESHLRDALAFKAAHPRPASCPCSWPSG